MFWSRYDRHEKIVEDESGRGPVGRHPSSSVAGYDQVMTGRSVADI